MVPELTWTASCCVLALAGDGAVQALMEKAFYPALLGVLVIASLGLPIPEDVPLIAAGVILRAHPTAASWPGAFATAMLGIMTGDLVLYSMGRRWGRDAIRHRWVRSLVTTQRLEWMEFKFHRHGVWMCFFGRFFMGVRAAMCVTAGATHFPYWKFFLADFCGALLSVPFFIWLGYEFADVIPMLRSYVARFQELAIALAAVLVLAYVLYEWRKFRRNRRMNLEYLAAHPAGESAPPVESGPPARAIHERPSDKGSGPARPQPAARR